MTKLSFFLLTSILSLFVFAIGYKIGDSRGYEAGYKAGYIYDCQAEVKELRQQHEDLKKAVDFARQKSVQVQQENSRLQYSREYYQDSLKNVERVKFLRDSVSKLKDKSGLYVNPYTGRVDKDVFRVLREAQKK